MEKNLHKILKTKKSQKTYKLDDYVLGQCDNPENEIETRQGNNKIPLHVDGVVSEDDPKRRLRESVEMNQTASL